MQAYSGAEHKNTVASALMELRVWRERQTSDK